MKNNHNDIRKMINMGCIAAMVICFAVPASASELTSSKIYTGTAQLVADVTLALTILCPTVCGLFALGFAIRRGMADQQDGKMWSHRIFTAIICGVAGGLISGVITLIASYYA